MLRLGRIQVLLAAFLALLCVSMSPVTAQGDDIVNFDGLYPKGALDCLYEAADSSKCKSKTVPATNSCFCRNGGNFIMNTAKCLGSSSRDLQTVYRTMKENCDNSETPISIEEKEFMAAAQGDSTTTSAKPSTTSATSTTATDSATTDPATTTTTGPASTSSSADDNGKDQDKEKNMSTGTIIGIAAGVSIAGVAFLAALAWFLVHRRKKGGEESHPMLPQQNLAPAVGHGPHDASTRSSAAYYGVSPPDTGGWPPKKEWGASPDPSVANRNSMFTWESPAHMGMIAPSPPLPQIPIQELDGIQSFPIGTAKAPAEMGGTPVVATPPQPQPQPTATGAGGNGQFVAFQPLGGQQQPYAGHPAWQ
ncbi:hypothetical protein N0V88_002794 [Collariella sp. IMI 366227]|nr:hypothetical protein N0V88_002794 [Collariella sp. IMI 366227]